MPIEPLAMDMKRLASPSLSVMLGALLLSSSVALERVHLPHNRHPSGASRVTSARAIEGRVPREDVAAVEDTVATVFDAFRPQEKDDDGWQFSTTFQESAGSLYTGCLVLRKFSAPRDEKLDDLGRLQPGAFATASALEKHLLSDWQYRTLALLSEWKAVAPAKVSGGTASQQLLVRRELDQAGQQLSPANWEEVQVNLVQISRETPLGPRWAVCSVYKDYHGPTASAASDYDHVDADPEELRDC